VNLVLGVAHVGAGVAEEGAPHHGLEQVAHEGAFAVVGDDGAADYQQPAGAGFLHGLDDAAGAVLAERAGAGTGAHRGDYGAGAVHGRADGGGVQDVGGDDLQPLACGDGQAGRVADDCGDLMPGR
jgi:hypothetical protein